MIKTREIYSKLTNQGNIPIWQDDHNKPGRITRIWSTLHVSDWSRAQFYLPSAAYDNLVRAVNITITGKQPRLQHGMLTMRIQIEFLRDDMPSEFIGGFMRHADVSALIDEQLKHANRITSEPIDYFGCFSTKEAINMSEHSANHRAECNCLIDGIILGYSRSA